MIDDLCGHTCIFYLRDVTIYPNFLNAAIAEFDKLLAGHASLVILCKLMSDKLGLNK